MFHEPGQKNIFASILVVVVVVVVVLLLLLLLVLVLVLVLLLLLQQHHGKEEDEVKTQISQLMNPTLMLGLEVPKLSLRSTVEP